jgi:tetratricopeptide (TPR) repeat protein
MRMTTHCDDEALYRHADGSTVTAELAAHLAACDRCAEELEAQRHITTALRTSEVWLDDQPRPAAQAKLSELAAFSRHLRDEDAEAPEICDDILTGPAAWWATRYAKSGYEPSAGVVRELLERMRELLARSPAQALHVTILAIEITNQLEWHLYPSNFLATLRGQALRDHAFVLGFIGRFPEALETAERAERLFRRTPVPHYEMARLQLVRASIYKSIDRLSEAVELAHESASVFLGYGDRKRYLDARTAEAAYLFQAQAVAEALAIWQAVAAEQQPATERTRVGIIHNIGLCYWELGELDKAAPILRDAMLQFETLGMEVERVRSRWALAMTLVAATRTGEAIPVLRSVQGEFEKLGMESDAALVGLKLVEALLAAGETETVPSICRDVLARFQRIGMTSPIAPAMSLLEEALAAGCPSPNDVRRVHELLRPFSSQSARAVAQA